MDPLMLLFRLLHVLAAVCWTGSAVLNAFFLFPAVRACGPAGGAVMGQIMNVRRMPVFMNATGAVTLLSGLGMFWRNGSLSGGTWLRTGTAHTLMLGAAFAIAGGIVGMTVTRRTAVRVAALGARIQAAGGPPSQSQMAEMATLQARLARALHCVAGLLLLAAAAMAVARYA